MAGLLLIAALVAYFLFTPLAKSEQVEYVYIDADDTQDSVFTKITPLANTLALNGLKNIARHTDYEKNIRTGRYAINPGEGALMTFRRLRNGMQSSMRLTIPEARTMDRLAALLGQKLMLDSAEIAEALLSEETCQHYGFDTATIAAMFVPDTYEVYWNTSLNSLLEGIALSHKFLEVNKSIK